MTFDTLISCIIPTHNRCALLERAIQSVLSQSYKTLEAIIVNEASSDDTEELIRRLAVKDRRVRYINNSSPLGPGGARNVGIASATGVFVAFLDDDDVWLDTKIDKQMAAIKGFDAILCGSITRSGKPMIGYSKNMVYLDDLKRGNILGSTSCFMATTSVMRANPFDEALACGEDWDLFIRLSKKARFRYLPEQLVIYDDGDHKRLTNLIRSDTSRTRSMLAVVNKHKDFLGSPWVNYHTASVLLSYLKTKPDKTARLLKALRLCGPVALVKVLLDKARALRFLHDKKAE
jgi:glycosyltransferase involved in cell wall biosynthesis